MIVLISLLFLLTACGGDDDSLAVPSAVPTATPEPLDFAATAADFECILDWTPVRSFRVANKLGLLDEALDVAKNPEAGKLYPVGTIIQLFAGEAMVKRGEGFDPDNNNWEYFELDVSAEGTSIRVRGRDDVVNRFGGQCFGCHSAARDFDFICEKNRGCVELPFDEATIRQLQEADPRCSAP